MDQGSVGLIFESYGRVAPVNGRFLSRIHGTRPCNGRIHGCVHIGHVYGRVRAVYTAVYGPRTRPCTRQSTRPCSQQRTCVHGPYTAVYTTV